MKEDAEVFCKLRVASTNNTGSNHSATIVYNGISANDWLSPIGISPSRHVENEKNGGVLVETLTKRPFTANSIIIIRPDRKSAGLEKSEALRGQHLRSACEGECSPNGHGGFTGIYKTSRGFVSKTMDFVSLRNQWNRTAMRPVTSNCSSGFTQRKFPKNKGIMKTTGNYTAVSIKRERDYNLDLTVQSVECSRKGADKTERDAQRFSESTKVAHTIFRTRFKDIDINTIDGIKRSYMKRAQSAPAGALRLNQLNDASHGKKPTLYWRAKSAYHRKAISKEEQLDAPNDDSYSETRGSLLRPLLYSSEGAIKHSAGCPYKCKGCFKACLVSEDYLDKAQQRSESERAQSSWRRQRRIRRSPGFSVQLALAKSQPLYQMVHEKGAEDKSAVKDAWAGDAKQDEDVVTRTQSLEISDDSKDCVVE
ncbi:hypothetical protein SNE40_018576 [Patella caerulea]|uniref:Uncharacterized protein n=1 Tax=Patella caerulea TaxID=87958 RepID=A0AAN8P866_PATCE